MNDPSPGDLEIEYKNNYGLDRVFFEKSGIDVD